MMNNLLSAAARRLRNDEGMTVIELVIAATLMLGAVTVIGGFLISMMKGGAFAQGQSLTLNDARNTMQSIEKEVRAADSLVWCAPAGSCLQIDTQSPSGDPKTVRYTHTGTDLQRALFNDATSIWGSPQTVVERVSNSGSEPLFDCDTTSTLLKVNIDLKLRPTPNSAPNYNLHTSVRPRNFPAVATCP
jgi:type II secretory pathway pseudopilin PulG